MKVIVTGSLSYDYIMDFPGLFADRIMPEKIHTISLSFLVDKLSKQFGGTAGNIAYTLKLLGIDPVIYAASGNDFAEYQEHLRRNKIIASQIMRHKNVSTGAYFVVTDQEDNQIGSFYSGSLKYNKLLTLKSVKHNFVVISANDPLAMKRYVKECQSKKLKYLYDPAFQIDNFSKDELLIGIKGAEVLIANDYEIALIEKKINYSHTKLVGVVPVLITTLGSKGSVVETKDQTLKIKPAKPKNTSDPTGAGDAYRAGFLAGYLRKYDLLACGQMGSVAAVYTVEKYGTQTHRFTLSQFCRRYKENYRKEIKL